MTEHINLIRAISSEFVSRKLRSIAVLAIIFAVVALAVVGWLTTMSAWWWLLAVPVVLLIIIGALAFSVALIGLRTLRPDLSKKQAAVVTAFVDKLERVADNLQTPMFIILFRVIRDAIRPREHTFIGEMTSDSTTLHSDFLKLQRDFQSK